MTAPTTASPDISRPASSPGLGSVILAEWTKFVSLRSTVICVALTLLVGVGLSSLAAVGIDAAGAESLPPGVDLVEQAAALARIGPVFGVIPLIVLAAQLSAREYPHQIRLTLAVHPRRW